jgi:hypothetical protein
MKGPAINITPVQRVGRIATGALGVMLRLPDCDLGGERR